MTREEWLALGCLDTPEQVAECISCPLPDCVNCQSRGGPSTRGKGRHTWDRKLARKLWEAGRLDSEISRSVGCTTETIRSWRKREGLQSNYMRRSDKHLEGLDD